MKNIFQIKILIFEPKLPFQGSGTFNFPDIKMSGWTSVLLLVLFVQVACDRLSN